MTKTILQTINRVCCAYMATEKRGEDRYRIPTTTSNKSCSPKTAACSQYTSVSKNDGFFDSPFTPNGETVPHKEQTRLYFYSPGVPKLVLSGMLHIA